MHSVSGTDCVINASHTDFLTERELRSFTVSRAYSLLQEEKKLRSMQKGEKVILSKKKVRKLCGI